MRETAPQSPSQYVEFGFSDAAPRQVSGYITAPVLELSGPLQPGIRVLDVGCGNGWMSAVFAERGCTVIGIDPSEQGVALARKAHPSVRFEVGEANERLLETLGEEPFDLVVSTEVVEHLYAPAPYAVGAFQALRPGGRFVCTTPYHGYIKNLCLALAGKHDFHTHPLRQGGHIKFWSRATLTTLLERAGFVDIDFKGAGRVPFLWKSMVMCGDRPETPASELAAQ
jgi:2-polyprenyl-3-methyl-5-hydroxy-6-metoxy-1,4-benzoquinol methylase